MKRFDWISAPDVPAATQAGTVTVARAMSAKDGRSAQGAAVLKAGGIDLLDLMKEGLLEPVRVVNLRDIPELAGIVEEPDGALRIGSMATLAQLAAHPAVRARYGALVDAAGRSASPQIRHVATIGGNLLQRPRCWYFRSLHHHCARKGGTTCYAFSGDNRYHAIFGHDGCAIVHPSTAATALVALDARVELVAAKRGKRVVALEKFFLGPGDDLTRENDLKAGEILAAVVLPPSRSGSRSAHLSQGELESFDWPIADVAVVVDVDASGVCRRASVVLGAAAPVPYRAKAAQNALEGKRISEDTARIAATAAIAGAVALSGNAYKLPVFEALVRRAILEAARPA
ncbi:MAG: FAD binding domain-containing protein [Usitatibacter sp.]